MRLFSRYEVGLSRAYYRTLKQLLAVRKQRLAPNSFFGETKPIPVENKQPPPDNEPIEPTEFFYDERAFPVRYT